MNCGNQKKNGKAGALLPAISSLSISLSQLLAHQGTRALLWILASHLVFALPAAAMVVWWRKARQLPARWLEFSLAANAALLLAGALLCLGWCPDVGAPLLPDFLFGFGILAAAAVTVGALRLRHDRVHAEQPAASIVATAPATAVVYPATGTASSTQQPIVLGSSISS